MVKLRLQLVLVLFLLAIAFPVRANIQFLQSATGTVIGASTSAVFANATRSGDTIIVALGINDPANLNIQSLSDNKGNTYKFATDLSTNIGNQNKSVSIYYAENIANGTDHNITVTSSGSAHITIAIHEYSGIARTNSFDTNSTNITLGSTGTTGNVTTRYPEELLFSAHWSYWSSTEPFTPTNNFVNRTHFANLAGGETMHTQDRIVYSIGTYESNGTDNSTPFYNVLATFRAEQNINFINTLQSKNQSFGNNFNLFIDNTNLRVGVGTSTPLASLEINGSGTSWPGLLVSNRSAPIFYVNTSSGNIGVGTQNATQKVTIQDGGLLQGYGNFTPKVVGGYGVMGTPGPTADEPYVGYSIHNSIIVAGKYAYVPEGSGFGEDLMILDISNPQNVMMAGRLTQSATCCSIESIAVSGNYAYAVGTLTQNDFRIYDISNASSPALVGKKNISEGSIVYAIQVSGQYAYVGKFQNTGTCSGTNLAGCEFAIYDISNPANIINVSGIDLPFINGQSISVSGRYVYVGSNYGGGSCTSIPDSCTFHVIDISDPANPVRVNGTGLGQDNNYIYVSGQYAYTINNPTQGTNDFAIINVSNPISLNVISSVDIPGIAEIWGLSVNGKYAYITTGNNSGNEMHIYDVSNVFNPVEVGGAELGNTTLAITVSGKYAYTVSRNFTVPCTGPTYVGCEFKVWDLGGIDAPAASIGNIAANTIDVSETARAGSLIVGSSLSVGSGGIYSQGPLGIFANGPNSLDVKTSTGVQLLLAQNNRTLGIGTSQPGSNLHVNGSGNSWSGLLVSNGSQPVFYVNSTSGNIGIGTQNATQKLTLQDGGLAQGYGNFTPRVVGGIGDFSPVLFTDRDAGPKSLAISGKYAYFLTSGNSGSSKNLVILDITNPQNIMVASSSEPFYLGGGCCAAYGIIVEGRYAYIADDAGLNVVDVSNVSSPVLTSYSVNPGQNYVFKDLSVSGKYAYTVSPGLPYVCSGSDIEGCEFRVYDISDPYNIKNFTGLDLSKEGLAVDVSGKYAYIGTHYDSGYATCDPTDNRLCTFDVIDISNPNNPVYINGLNLSGDTVNIVVSGANAFVLTNPPSTKNFAIINISNPNAPNILSSVGFPGIGGFYGLAVSGKYALITMGNNSGNELRIFDVSNAANPIEVGGLELLNTTGVVAIGGKYAYVASADYTGTCSNNNLASCEFKVIDLGGIDAPAASIGNIAANTLDVSETARVGSMIVGSSLAVGPGGIYSQGTLGIFANGPNALDVKTSTGVQLLLAQSNRTVGIGTSQPGSNLHVNGSGNSWGGLLVSNGTNNNIFYVNSTSGNIGIGTQNATQKVTIQDGGLAQGYGNFTPKVMGGYGFGTNDNSPLNTLQGMIAVSGKYAYVGVSETTVSSHLDILDISNPQNVVKVGSFLLGNQNQIRSVFVSGTIAYVLDSPYLYIVDVSNASAPTSLGLKDITAGAGIPVQVFVSGKYAYITNTHLSGVCSGTDLTGCELKIFDISNPANPMPVGGLDDEGAGNQGFVGVYVSGTYAYLAGAVMDDACPASILGCEFRILDVSDPSNPRNLSGFDFYSLNLNLAGGKVYVSGGNAYVLTNQADHAFIIINVTNPSAAALLSTTNITNITGTGDISVAGKYAYVSVSQNNGNELVVYDISNAARPVLVGGIEIGNDTYSLRISGKYAYTLSTNFTVPCISPAFAGCEFKVWDIGGLDAPAASIGNIAANTLDVSENARTGSLVVGTSLSVGSGGIYSQGPLAILSNPSSPLFALDVKNSAGQLLFNVQNYGGVGINTTPVNGALLQANSSGGALIYRDNGNLGVTNGASVILPTNLLTLRGTTSSTLLNITDGAITYGVYIGLLSSDRTSNFIDTTDTDWNAGTHAGTAVEGSGSIANLTNTSGTKAGTFQSQIFNGGRNTGWRSMRVSSEANYDTEIGRANGDTNGGTLPGINTTGLVLLYHFNNESDFGENGTLFRDFSPDANSGKVANNGTCSGTACTVYNFSNKQLGRGSMEFDGTDDHVDVRKINVDTTPGRRNTVAFWMYWTGDGNGGTGREPIGWGETDTSTHYELWMNSSPNCLGFNTHNWDCWGVPTTGLENRWVHFVAIFHNGPTSQSQIYIDGINRTLSGPSGTQTISENLTIGGASGGDGSFPFQGRIDEIAVWNRSLTPGEIQNLYLRGTIRLNISARVCDDPACSGDAFQLIPNITDGYAHALNLTTNMQYFQYNVSFINATQNHTTFRINDVTTGFLSETGASIGTMTNHTLRLYTNNTDRLEIGLTGNVGINVMNPTQKLTVMGSGNFTSNLTISSQSGSSFNVSGITLYNESNIAICLRIRDEGVVESLAGGCGG